MCVIGCVRQGVRDRVCETGCVRQGVVVRQGVCEKGVCGTVWVREGVCGTGCVGNRVCGRQVCGRQGVRRVCVGWCV